MSRMKTIGRIFEPMKLNEFVLFFKLVRSEIQAVIGEANLLIGGKLKQFRGLCQSNIVWENISSVDFG